MPTQYKSRGIAHVFFLITLAIVLILGLYLLKVSVLNDDSKSTFTGVVNKRQKISIQEKINLYADDMQLVLEHNPELKIEKKSTYIPTIDGNIEFSLYDPSEVFRKYNLGLFIKDHKLYLYDLNTKIATEVEAPEKSEFYPISLSKLDEDTAFLGLYPNESKSSGGDYSRRIYEIDIKTMSFKRAKDMEVPSGFYCSDFPHDPMWVRENDILYDTGCGGGGAGHLTVHIYHYDLGKIVDVGDYCIGAAINCEYYLGIYNKQILFGKQTFVDTKKGLTDRFITGIYLKEPYSGKEVEVLSLKNLEVSPDNIEARVSGLFSFSTNDEDSLYYLLDNNKAVLVTSEEYSNLVNEMKEDTIVTTETNVTYGVPPYEIINYNSLIKAKDSNGKEFSIASSYTVENVYKKEFNVTKLCLGDYRHELDAYIREDNKIYFTVKCVGYSGTSEEGKTSDQMDDFLGMYDLDTGKTHMTMRDYYTLE